MIKHVPNAETICIECHLMISVSHIPPYYVDGPYIANLKLYSVFQITLALQIFTLQLAMAK